VVDPVGRPTHRQFSITPKDKVLEITGGIAEELQQFLLFGLRHCREVLFLVDDELAEQVDDVLHTSRSLLLGLSRYR
jgi:hypothetical protein